MRKYYLDNLRIIMILLLFPVHTFMIWNNFGTKFYVWDGENNLLSTLITIINPWFMSVLFIIAGICARYSLKKRDTIDFIKERFKKLLIPFISGVILLVPIQTFYARKFFFDYNGTILDNYRYFFTHFTDLSGYDGAFTPGHLWFILFLFVISLISLIIIKYILYEKISSKIEKLNIVEIILLFIPIWILYYVGNFNGFSLGKYFILYLLGYYILSNDIILEKLINNKKIVITLFLVFQLVLTILYYKFSYYGDLLVNIVAWLGSLTCLIIGKIYLNNKTSILSHSSFQIYILHQSILVIIGYYVICYGTNNILLNSTIIMFLSFLITIMAYKLLKHIPYIRKLFGMKY